jgi:UDP-N-acetylglucosamine 2-epimerase (non-hydrolysing)/GDP/UDP-N,N'-diacetylbacillosamine 2-epimerase (hydrolysing)
MSGGDRTGSIDDSIRNAISSFAHVHLTTCERSTQRLTSMGEAPQRIFEVGEPALDVIRALQPLSREQLSSRFGIDPNRPFALATQHPVTTEAADSAAQVTNILRALEALDLQTIFTYPNTDTGSAGIVDELEAWRGRSFLRLAPHVGQDVYLSLMKAAAVMVGNSSSGLIEAASFHLPVVNIGTRQYGRMRPANVIDAGYDTAAIRRAIEFALHDEAFRCTVGLVKNPYGDGRCAERTADILAHVALGPALIAKWIAAPASFLG